MQYSPWIAAQSVSACSQDGSAWQATHMKAYDRVQNQRRHERSHGWRPVTANAT
jgi:hypothetical protein